MDNFRRMLRAKLHRAVVTHADLEYEGSLTIPPDLCEAADIREYEAVSVWNITRGTRFDTYAIKGLPESRDICANGAAAHLAKPGDRVIIACFTHIPESALETHKPRLVFVDEKNQQVELDSELPGPQRRTPNPEENHQHP